MSLLEIREQQLGFLLATGQKNQPDFEPVQSLSKKHIQPVVLPSGPLRHPQEHDDASPTACNEGNSNHTYMCRGDHQSQHKTRMSLYHI